MNVEEIDFKSKFNSFFHDATSAELRGLYDVLNYYEEDRELRAPSLVVAAVKSNDALEFADVFWRVKRPFVCWETFDETKFEREFFTALSATVGDPPERRSYVCWRAALYLDSSRFLADRAADGTAGIVATTIRRRRRKFGYYFLRNEKEKFEEDRARNLAFLLDFHGKEKEQFVAVVSELSGYIQ